MNARPEYHEHSANKLYWSKDDVLEKPEPYGKDEKRTLLSIVCQRRKDAPMYTIESLSCKSGLVFEYEPITPATATGSAYELVVLLI